MRSSPNRQPVQLPSHVRPSRGSRRRERSQDLRLAGLFVLRNRTRPHQRGNRIHCHLEQRTGTDSVNVICEDGLEKWGTRADDSGIEVRKILEPDSIQIYSN